MSADHYRDIARLSPAKREELLRLMDRMSGMSEKRGVDREHDRFEYRAVNVPVTITHPAGGSARFLIFTRNLSSGGMSFLHAGYLHTGTLCRTLLTSLDGKDQIVLGRVASCRLVAQRLHEVCVQFYDKIDVRRFCPPSARVTSPGRESMRSEVSVSVPTLDGIALCLLPDPDELRSATAALSSAGIDAIPAGSMGAALDRIKRLPFDIALCDYSLPEARDGRLADLLRSAGFSGVLIMLMTAQSGRMPRVEGAHAALVRPLDASALYGALSALLSTRQARADESPLHSPQANDPGARALLDAYIADARQSARRIREGLAENDRVRVLTACRHLSTTAVGYGYASLAMMAQGAVEAINSGEPLDQSARRLLTVASMCSRLSPDPEGAEPSSAGAAEAA